MEYQQNFTVIPKFLPAMLSHNRLSGGSNPSRPTKKKIAAMPFCTKWHSCDSLFFVQFTAQLIAYRLPAFFVLLHKCHVLRGYINITVVAFFGGCVLIAEVPKNQKALVDMNGTLPSALVHRPPKVITPTSRHAPVPACGRINLRGRI